MAYVRFPLAAVFFGGLRNVFLISTVSPLSDNPPGATRLRGAHHFVWDRPVISDVVISVCQPEQMNLATHNLFDPLRDTVMSCVWYSSVTLRRPRTSRLSICRGFDSVHKACQFSLCTQ
ncbi:hypothetical protein EV401DRAFT_1037849 [Pisolithus croceorrhizus]|nr:hypothetical protein EV401DRAFT_1037849 [Pisolithus croceorrhizus]